jgi:hypothetical protein
MGEEGEVMGEEGEVMGEEGEDQRVKILLKVPTSSKDPRTIKRRVVPK